MRTFLIVLVLIHGTIHTMGFIQAYSLTDGNVSTLLLSKPVGLVWLLMGILFVTTALLMLLKKEWWPIVALLTVILSQILIIVFWKDAKFGTIANMIVLIAGLLGYGEFQFNRMVRRETQEILKNLNLEHPGYIRVNDIQYLPTIVQKWLISSGVLENERVFAVRLSQKGKMKTRPDSKWMPFTAHQYFNCTDPSFIWNTRVRALPLVSMNGRDKLALGEGQMLIKLFSLIPVVNEGNNDKINGASLQRFLAELCWFPAAAINDYLRWEELDENSVKAILTIAEKTVSGIFEFTADGKLRSFETDRYYGGDEDAVMEKWLIEMVDFKEFNGIQVPNKCKITWKLKGGDFNWLNLEITDLEYNKPFIYQ